MKTKVINIDKTALQFNQFSIVVLTAIAFVFNLPWVVAFVAAVMLVGTIFPRAGLFKLFYKIVIKKTGLLKENIAKENSTPHQFAQGLGGAFLLIAILFLMVINLPAIGWLLTLLVMLLALINLTVNFCLGCFIYYQLGKIGFVKITNEVKN